MSYMHFVSTEKENASRILLMLVLESFALYILCC